MFYIAGFVALLNILQWTYGQAILGDAQAAKPLGVLKNPLVIAFAVGLLLYFLPITLPVIFTNAVSSVAACNAPVAMVILGVLLGNISPKRMFLSKEAWLVGGVRLLLIPLLTLLLLKAFPGVPGEMRGRADHCRRCTGGLQLGGVCPAPGRGFPGCRRDGVPFHHLVHYHHAPGPAGFLTWAEN